MTLATLDQLFGEVPLEHQHLERYGYREDTVAGRRRYVGRDSDGRAVVGPVRHRAKGLLSLGRKKKVAPLPVQERSMKIVIDEAAVRRAGEAVRASMGILTESLETVDFSKLVSPTPPPHKEPGKMRRAIDRLTDLWYDEEWHKGARNTAGTILLWSFTAFAVLTFVKGALWVLSI